MALRLAVPRMVAPRPVRVRVGEGHDRGALAVVGDEGLGLDESRHRAGQGRDDLELSGELTINGITRAVSFPVEFSGVEVHPADGKDHAGFSASTVVNRNDFGVDFNMPLGMDKLALGEKVNVELELQFVTD